MMVGTKKKVVEVVGGYVRSIGRTLFTRQRFISSFLLLLVWYNNGGGSSHQQQRALIVVV